jgi:uncharacterized protein (TIRG00374 family)
MLKNWKFWIGLLVSITFLVWALWGLDLNGFVNEVANGNYWWLIPSVLTYFVAVWVRTWRWDYMLRPLKQIPMRKLFPVVVIGYMGNNIYPLRMGELLRSYVLWRREDVPVGASLGTVVVERVFDGVIMLIFVFIGLPFLPFPGDYQFLVTVASVAFLGALLVFFALAAMPDRALTLAEFVFNLLLPNKASEPLLNFTQKFLDGLKGLREFKNVLMIFFTSLVIWLLETVKYWFVMQAFDFGDAAVPFFGLMLMNGVVNLATTLPTAPGYVGTFDGPGIAVLVAYGVAQPVATAYTLVLHIALWLPITVLGGWYMLREGLSWSDMTQAAGLSATNDQ